MNNELIYLLRMPSIEEVIPEIEKYKIKFQGVKIYGADIIHPNWKTFCGVKWDYVAIFNRYNESPDSYAHSDSTNPKLTKTWGINFHINGYSLFEHYNHKDVASFRVAPYAEHFRINAGPTKTYYMPEGVYLVNTHLPHRVVSYQDRICISLRCSSMYNVEWDDIVERFKDYIIDQPLSDKIPDEYFGRG